MGERLMSRAGTTLVFVVSIAIVGMAAFYGGTLFAMLPHEQGDASQEIIDAAKKNIPRPQLPPKPSGQIVTTIEERKQIVKVPSPSIQNFGRTRDIVTTIQVPSTKLVDAPAEVVAAWDSQVKKLEDEYNKRLSQEIDRISRNNMIETVKQYTKIFKDVATEIIVPALIAIAGIIGAFTALIKAFKSPPRPSDVT